jgi:hypothetical protein
MPEIIADPPDPSCYLLFSAPGIEESQSVDSDPFCLARNARGRFAKGSSGNSSGIPNPKRRVPDVAARPLRAEALSDLIDRRPHLLRPLAAQVLSPPLASTDSAKHLRIDLSSLRTVEDVRQMLPLVLTAVARGEIAPAEAARIARRVYCPAARGLGASHAQGCVNSGESRRGNAQCPSRSRMAGCDAGPGKNALHRTPCVLRDPPRRRQVASSMRKCCCDFPPYSRGV